MQGPGGCRDVDYSTAPEVPHVPESQSRKSGSSYTPPPKPKPVKIGSPRWIAPAMVACFLIGLIWIVAFYIAPGAPFLKTLDFWNVLIGFGFIALGFVFATRWK